MCKRCLRPWFLRLRQACLLDVVRDMVVLTATASVITDLALCSDGFVRNNKLRRWGPWNDVSITKWTIKLLGLILELETLCNWNQQILQNALSLLGDLVYETEYLTPRSMSAHVVLECSEVAEPSYPFQISAS